MDEGYCQCVHPPIGGASTTHAFRPPTVRVGSKPVRLVVSKCFPVCPAKAELRFGVLNSSPNGGPPMMRGDQHETHDRCNHSPDDVSSRSNSGASTNRSRCAIDRSGGDRTDQR